MPGMADTIYRSIPQKDRRISVEMTKPNGRRRVIPDFVDEAEANAWIIQTKRLPASSRPKPIGSTVRASAGIKTTNPGQGSGDRLNRPSRSIQAPPFRSSCTILGEPSCQHYTNDPDKRAVRRPPSWPVLTS
jgi:hypothetical protein